MHKGIANNGDLLGTSAVPTVKRCGTLKDTTTPNHSWSGTPRYLFTYNFKLQKIKFWNPCSPVIFTQYYSLRNAGIFQSIDIYFYTPECLCMSVATHLYRDFFARICIFSSDFTNGKWSFYTSRIAQEGHKVQKMRTRPVKRGKSWVENLLLN
jgi:hypothetical protein